MAELSKHAPQRSARRWAERRASAWTGSSIRRAFSPQRTEGVRLMTLSVIWRLAPSAALGCRERGLPHGKIIATLTPRRCCALPSSIASSFSEPAGPKVAGDAVASTASVTLLLLRTIVVSSTARVCGSQRLAV